MENCSSTHFILGNDYLIMYGIDLHNNKDRYFPIETSGTKKITKVLKGRKLRTKKVREYLVRYSDPTCEDEWLEEKDIPEATKLLRRFRHTRNTNITK